MVTKLNKRGFTIIEVLVAAAIFLIFAVGVYSGIQIIFKIVYQSRMRILETALLSEELEIVRNLPFDSIGIVGGAPPGILSRTKIVNRDGVNFNIETTVRNIDDPFDGTMGGTPSDISPADYKLIELSVFTTSSIQNVPVTLSTIVAPRGLEGASQNGALFVNVFNAAGHPVPGASVHVQNSETLVDDVTDDSGILKIVDIPTGTLKYSVTVSKNGYSQDQTYAQSVSNPLPTKLPVTVISQTVSEIFLSIDLLGSLSLRTVNESCAAIPNIGFTIHGTKIIGREPDIYKYTKTFTTDGSGVKDFGAMEWDTYTLALTTNGYDLMGTTPMNPLYLNPGAAQQVFLILRPHTANSLLVKVKDAGTGLPLSGATVRLTDGGYDQSLVTGLGYVRQTDWSGGSGQGDYVVQDEYFSDSDTLTINSPDGDLKLKKTGSHYSAAGTLESSTFDLGDDVNYSSLVWEPLDQPPQTESNSLRFQLAGSASSSPASWTFLGPDGTAESYYTVTSTAIWSGLDGKRYLRYRAFLSTADTRFTPTLSEIALNFTNSCEPPGQSFFTNLSAGAYGLEISRPGYTANSGSIEVSGNSEATVNLSVSE